MPKRHRDISDYCRRSKYTFLQARRNRDAHREESDDEEQASNADPRELPLPPAPNDDSIPATDFNSSEGGSEDGDSAGSRSGEESSGSDDSPSSSDPSGDSSESDDEQDYPNDSPSEPSSSDEEENGDNLERDEDPLLFQGGPLTVGESMLSIMTFALTHNLPDTALSDLLDLISLHCPEPNNCTSTVYKFKKYFAGLRSPLLRRYYCSICLTPLNNENEICVQCNRRRGVSYFIEMPVIPQLQSLYKRPNFYEKLRNNQDRRRQVEGNYEDIYHGSLYQALLNPGNFLHDENSISLTWYSDGVRIFRSSRSELWPFYLTINELPYSERVKIDNTLIAGLWYGKVKPRPNLFLRYIREEFLLLRRGIPLTLPQGNVIRVKGVVMCGIADLPAKAIFLNHTMFNGTYGCQVCKIQSVRLNPNQPKRIYPFQRHLQLRTDEENIVFARNAFDLGRAVIGVKGPSALAPFVDRPIESTTVDILHECYLGLAKMLGLIWFDKKFSEHQASICGYGRVVDQRLASLKVPHFLQRQPRSIDKHFSYWKGSEFKMWLLVYSLPLLEDILPNYYFEHHKLLVLGVSLLNCDSVSPAMVDLASAVLIEYVSRFEDLYGRAHLSANLHLLLHLNVIVRRLGPLWATSAFPYESMNGVFKKLVSGTRFADLQIFSAASMFINLTAFKTNMLDAERPAYKFCNRLTAVKRKFKLKYISDRMAVVGKMFAVRDVPGLVGLVMREMAEENEKICCFNRLLEVKHKILFTCVSYNRGTKVNSSCVKYRVAGRDSFGIVHTFFRVTECECRGVCDCQGNYYAVVQKCNVNTAFRADPGGPLPRFHRCTYTQRYLAVDVEDLLLVCFLIHIQDSGRTFIVEPVNTIERE